MLQLHGLIRGCLFATQRVTERSPRYAGSYLDRFRAGLDYTARCVVHSVCTACPGLVPTPPTWLTLDLHLDYTRPQYTIYTGLQILVSPAARVRGLPPLPTRVYRNA